MRRTSLMAFALLWLAAWACQNDKGPRPFEDLDEDVATGADVGTGQDEEQAPGGPCFDHTDCLSDELCFEDHCLDREDALDSCLTDDDCPQDFVCVDEDHCEEP